MGGTTTELIQRLLADPPPVHTDPVHREFMEPPKGVWHSEPLAYQAIADNVRQGSRTLETGCGVSTALFAELGSEHICVVFLQSEADRLLAYCVDRGIDVSHLRFEIGSSHEVLPRLEPGELDLVFIDGCHGFPFPHVDFLYGARHLVEGGVLVVDDVDLPAPGQVTAFLLGDQRWQLLHHSAKTAAFRLVEKHALAEEWPNQPWTLSGEPGLWETAWPLARVKGERLARRIGGPVKRRLKAALGR